MIEVKHLEKYYGSDGTVTKALDDISFISYDGEFLCIMGASGSGKSTLLNCLSTIDCASAGDILFNGVSFDSLKKSELAAFRRHNLGFIFQNYNLLDTLTLGENISLSLLINGAAQGTIQKRIHDIANQVGIGHLLDKLPSQVSGGERQRCAFARAVVNSPKLIFADEPTGALDSKTGRTVMDLFHELNRNQGKTIVLITHSTGLAEETDRIITISDGTITGERAGSWNL
jgi:putative ABC transport system ATP-binding protein